MQRGVAALRENHQFCTSVLEGLISLYSIMPQGQGVRSQGKAHALLGGYFCKSRYGRVRREGGEPKEEVCYLLD